jgi:hypothetical protein
VRKVCLCLCPFACVCVCVRVFAVAADYAVVSALFCGLDALAANAIMLIVMNAQIPGARLPVAQHFFTVASNISGSATQICLHVSHLSLRILRFLLNFGQSVGLCLMYVPPLHSS